MNGFDPRHPRGSYPGFKAAKPQYVLLTDNGAERTSNVTPAKVIQSVYEIDRNEYVTLEKCIPVIIMRRAEAIAMSYYKSSRVAVHFRVERSILRMVRDNVRRDEAADMMCDFFQSAKLPNMDGWRCEEFLPAPRKSTTALTVDGEDFRYFGSADVLGALENIIEGKSRWMLYDITGEDGGYMNIRRITDTVDGAKFEVEFVRWTEPLPTGYRAVITDIRAMRIWLWDLVDGRKYPDATPEWESFDVTDYFQRLAFRFLDEEDER